MTKGDVVNGSLAAGGTFQPASGVEVVITSISGAHDATACNWALYDGAVRGYFGRVNAAASLSFFSPVKVFITNALYLYAQQTGSYSGVQVK